MTAVIGMAAASSHAAVVIAGTRVIYPAAEREVTVKLNNVGNSPALVQTWIDKGDANESPDKIDVPFTLTPSMFRIDPSKGQTLRMIYTKEPLAQDKESLFWLNVLEVPPKPSAEVAGENHLQLAIRTRIKVLFRPTNLAGKSEEAPAQVKWTVERSTDGKGWVLKGMNPAAYYVNLGNVALHTGGKTFEAGAGYIAPGESSTFPVNELNQAPAAVAEVEYLSINDYGAGMTNKRPLDTNAAH
ncbi:fimbria/pilus periplasmic chaperone [Burkholderia sp. BE17]|uniref:fimbria/pilus periplasmic chaperone n=1 Tax=Burkholderia sp. BE17 TaxID=2656644 RepID=UPI002AB1B64D|nr:fimbria/pilus periplasmic chaperone [Burkholderia sp. BE17]